MQETRLCSVVPALALLASLLLAGCGEDITNVISGAGDESVRDPGASGPAACYESDPLLDTDGDGLTNCDEIEFFGTSPLLQDTDGDGLTDFQEIVEFGFSPFNNNFKFNPRIADVPKIDIRFTSAPDITLLYTSSTGSQLTHQVSRTAESANTVSTSRSESNSLAVSASHTSGSSVTAGVSATVNVSLVPSASVTASVEATVSYEFTSSTSSERSLSFSSEQSGENRQGLEDTEALASSEGTQVNGGRLAVTVEAGNTGLLSFDLTELVLSAYIAAPGSGAVLKPLGTLSIAGGIPDLTYGPNQFSGPFVFETGDLDVDSTRRLAVDANGLVLRVAGYQLTDENGKGFNHNLTAINAKTASVIIDYAEANGRPIERYMVATNTDPSVLRIPAAEALQGVLALEKNGAVALKSYTTGAGGVLQSVRGVAANPAIDAFWMVLHRQTDGITETVAVYDPTVAGYDFDALELKSGDVLHLVYYADPDLDGLDTRQERTLGTDPAIADSDGDGLSDGDEVFLWRTSPLNLESDGDGYPDGWEFDVGSHPGLRVSTPAARITAGMNLFGAGLNATGLLKTWGSNFNVGALGRTAPDCSSWTCDPNAAEPAPGQAFVAVAAGDSHTLALRSDGTLWSWGDNNRGQLGRVGDMTVPGQVGADSDWVAAFAGGQSSFGIRSDGTLWSWGVNRDGELGRSSSDTCPGAIPCALTPGQVGTDSDWVMASTRSGYEGTGASEAMTLAIKSDGTLWSWGSNLNGGLGRTPDGTFPADRPGPVGTDRDWQNATVGFWTNFATKRDGTLWSWGMSGAMAQFGTDADWAAVYAFGGDSFFELALKRDGTLWSWEDNSWGQLGRPCGGFCPTPGQVGTDADWVAAAGSARGFSFGYRRNRSLWSWGTDSGLGQLGGSCVGPCPTPAQVPNF